MSKARDEFSFASLDVMAGGLVEETLKPAPKLIKRGRPKKEEPEPIRMTSVRLTVESLAKLRALAALKGVSARDLHQEAIDALLRQHESTLSSL